MSTTEPTTVPTQVEYPWKAAARTAVQTFLALAALLAIAWPIVSEFLQAYVPEAWLGYLAAGVVFVTGLAAVITRLMALPQVDAFLALLHFGAKPTGAHRATD
ncbi:hypothetical protein [Rathayibacter sp. VKM Ac-2630]|uniref:hypothetical protein n=1 Tax=Rathayibacter sp. VKM Ac-2630 TaxID=1938617 RepID=UPI0009826803|nr:hypothetical protein [Rathayibacter sp. VKM Ac-2630]OOB90757.1 hypothetical protein B0T42_10140 [Rathayibacter sp. VKM Ac-2630]